MPIYEFECSACHERFDRLQKISDPDPDACPNCGAAGVRRRLTAPAFRLAGSGWYETDFKKDAEKKRNLAEKGEPAKTEAKKPDDKKPSAPAASAEKPAAKDKSAEAKRSEARGKGSEAKASKPSGTTEN